MQHYYKVLGVPENATAAEIKSAYRRLALQYHPDRNPSANAAARFIAIKTAYDVLSDPVLRRNYDQELLYWRTTGSSVPPKSSNNHSTKYYTPGTSARKTPTASSNWWVPVAILLAIQMVIRLGSQPTYHYSSVQLPDSVVRTIILQHNGKLHKTDSVILAPGNSATDSANLP